MKKTLTFLSILLLTIVTTGTWISCSKKSNNTSGSGSQALVIQTGAQSIAPNVPMQFTAVLVDKNGNTTVPSNVSWSVSGNGGISIGSFSGSTFTGSAVGYGTITASATVNGSTLTASLPIGVYTPGLFAVVPSAVIWTTGAGTIPLTPVYLGIGTTTYTYSSSDATIASVDASGVITFNKAGTCAITVTANGLSGSPSVIVPVMVTGTISVTLPVTRVSISPNAYEMFRGDNTTLAAKAYDMNGNQVTSSSFTWASQNTDIATVDQSGKVTGVSLGKAIITATASGITGQAEVDVLPDTVIMLNPIWASIAAGDSQQFTATTYTVNHSTKTLNTTPIANPSLTWTIPTYGVPVFDIATVSGSGMVKMKSSATIGLGSIVMATPTSPTTQPGVSMITVSDCNCGAGTAGVTGITVTSPITINISLTSGTITSQILASTVGASGTLNYCSNSMSVCSVDASGLITASGPGTATIKICCGSVQTTITVNVTM